MAQVVTVDAGERINYPLLAGYIILMLVAVAVYPIILMIYAVWIFMIDKKESGWLAAREFLWPFGVGLAIAVSTGAVWWFGKVWPIWALILAGTPYVAGLIAIIGVVTIVMVALTGFDDD